MPLSFLTPFEEALLQSGADTYATLSLVLSVRFKLLNHFNLPIPEFHDLVELKNQVRTILNETFKVRKLHRNFLFLSSNFSQLRMLSREVQEETIRTVAEIQQTTLNERNS
jgi:hypothetical protein